MQRLFDSRTNLNDTAIAAQIGQAPRMTALTEELPAGDWLARECFPYGLAALLVADDDKAKFNWAATEYSERLLSHCPAQFTAVQEMI